MEVTRKEEKEMERILNFQLISQNGKNGTNCFYSYLFKNKEMD